MERRLRLSPRDLIRFGAVGALFIATLAGKAEAQNDLKVADKSPIPTPTVQPTKALTLTLKATLEKIGLQLAGPGQPIHPPNPYFFTDSLARQRMWFYDNARNGIPPNSPAHLVGTIDDYTNCPPPVYTTSCVWLQTFQAVESYYPEISSGAGLGILGQVVDNQAGRGFIATGLLINNVTYPRAGEMLTDVNSPNNLSARVNIPEDGDWPQGGGSGGNIFRDYIIVDGSEQYLLPTLHNMDNPAANGAYRRRITEGITEADRWVKISNLTTTPTPTSTRTPTPTQTPTITPTLDPAIASSLRGSLSYQGRQVGTVSYLVPLEVKLYQRGTTNLLRIANPTTTSAGDFTVSGIGPGNYDVEVKHAQFLSNKTDNLSFTPGSVTNKGFGQLRTGDADNSNIVNILDFSNLRLQFATATNCGTANPSVVPCGDFDGNGFVNILDFSLLASNFGTAGPRSVP